MSGLGEFPDRIWLVETATGGRSEPEIVESVGDANGYDFAQEYVAARDQPPIEAKALTVVELWREGEDISDAIDALAELFDDEAAA